MDIIITTYDNEYTPINEITAKSWIKSKYVKMTNFGLPHTPIIASYDSNHKLIYPDYYISPRSEIYLELRLSDFNYKIK